jgi:hypothetical protein
MMNMKYFNLSVFLLIFTTCFFGGCAPGLGATVNLNSVSKIPSETTRVYSEEDGVKLNVLNFSDNRAMDAIVEIDGRLIKPEGDVGLAAQKIFEAAAKSAGVKLSLFHSPSVRGAIREWRVSVVPSFPSSKLTAIASVSLDLLDRDGNVILTSVYSGNYDEQNPFMSDSQVEQSLGKAMAFALAEAFKDSQFVSKLSAVANTSQEQNY